MLHEKEVKDISQMGRTKPANDGVTGDVPASIIDVFGEKLDV